MGRGPAPASEKILNRLSLKISDFDLIELYEAFVARAQADLRLLALPDDAEQVNPQGGAIAPVHTTGYEGARLVATASA